MARNARLERFLAQVKWEASDQDSEAARKGVADDKSSTRDVAAMLREFESHQVDEAILDLRNNRLSIQPDR